MRSVHQWCALSMLAAIIALLYAGIAGHFSPTPLPSDPLSKVTELYQLYRHKILIFAFFNCLMTVLTLPAFCALSAAIMRMKPGNMTLALLQLTSGIMGTVGPFLGSMFLAAAVARTDQSPSVLAALTDLTVIYIEMSTLPALLLGVSLATAIFSDRSPQRVLPRWYGVMSLGWGVMAQGGLLAVFYESGPLSSTGFIGIFLPIASLFVWMAGTTAVLFRLEPEDDDAREPLPISVNPS